MTPAAVVLAARGWLGTPFHASARIRGVGVDCAGLVIGVARELGLVAPDFDVPPYLQRPDGKTLIAWCEQYMTRVTQPREGDVAVTLIDEYPQHLGILAPYRHGGFSIIHACNAASCTPPRVIETRLMLHRANQLVSVYRLPGVA
jgi:hypothetical protein